jgi:hypothetical protein
LTLDFCFCSNIIKKGEAWFGKESLGDNRDMKPSGYKIDVTCDEAKPSGKLRRCFALFMLTGAAPRVSV